MNPERVHELRPRLILVAIAVACVIVPYLTWRQTWFGRRLSQAEVGQYLADEQHPRKIQHALTFLAEQMAKADPAARVWYPGIVQAAHRPSVEIRTLAAWTMGQDNQSDILHQALLGLLDDPEVLVRRNAALALVRFGDERGRPELAAMLRPLAIRSPEAGIVSLLVQLDQVVGRGSVIARVQTPSGRTVELLSPARSHVAAVQAPDGARIAANDAVASLGPDQDDVWEALRALYLIGDAEDLPAVDVYAAGAAGASDRVSRQAVETARAIRKRTAPNPTR
jgi:HEAT repeat protein